MLPLHKATLKDKCISGTNAAVVYALSPGQANDNPIDCYTTWGQKHWTDSMKKLTDKPYEEVLKI